MILETIAFLRSDLGKATAGLFTGVICFCWPAVVAYPAGAACFYYAIHRFRPVGLWIYNNLREDLKEDAQADGNGG